MKTEALKAFLICLLFGSCAVIKPEKKEEIFLYKIAATPVRLKDYQLDKQYISDYLITKSYALADSDRVTIKKLLKDDSVALKGFHRQCEFSPNYAVKLASNETILISLAPCTKIQVINKKNDPVRIDDLKNDSDLEKWILKTASRAFKTNM